MYHSPLNDPSQLTVFDPLPADAEEPKEESVLLRVLRRVKGNPASSSSGRSPSSSRRGSFNDGVSLGTNVVPRYTASMGSVELNKVVALPTEADASLFAPAVPSPRPSVAGSSSITEQSAALVNHNEVDNHPRNLGNILQRIKAIAAKGSSDLQPYRDSDFKQYWMPDASSKECYDCGEKFTTFRRRRHCRICGQIFCYRCANQEIPGRLLGYAGSLRMCSFCSEVVLSYVRYAQSSNSAHSHASDNQQEFSNIRVGNPLPTRGSRAKTSSNPDESRYQLFCGDPQTSSEQPFQRSRKMSIDVRTFSFEQLREIWLELNHTTEGLELKIHRHRFRAFPECVSGVEIVDWLVKKGKAASRKQAVRIGQGLLNFKFLECLTTHDAAFSDEYVLYKPKTITTELEDVATLTSSEYAQENDDPTWLQEIHQLDDSRRSRSDPLFDMSSSPGVDDLFLGLGLQVGHNLKRRSDSNVSLNSQLPHAATVSPCATPTTCLAPSTTQIPEEVAFGNVPELDLFRYPDTPQPTNDVPDDVEILYSLNEIFKNKLDALLHRVEAWEGLDDKEWHDVIIALALRVTENVAPSVKDNRDDMDVRQYVHIKKIPGGRPSESRVIFGVVCTKHVAHRKMRQNFVNPTVLLYASALEYQRVEQKLSSLEPILQQEAEFLKNYVTKISEFRPDILLVERNVSRLAQDYLFQEGITLAANMKESVMNRLARCLGSEKFSIVDERFTKPRLGTCSKFDVKTVNLPDGTLKSYMTFDGCPKNRGCTILIRGATKETLQKVKKILTFVIYCQYNWRLERAFLMDETAAPPENIPFLPNMETAAHDSLASILKSFISSASPFVDPVLPFLESEEGQKSALRLGLSGPFFWSQLMDRPQCASPGLPSCDTIVTINGFYIDDDNIPSEQCPTQHADPGQFDNDETEHSACGENLADNADIIVEPKSQSIPVPENDISFNDITGGLLAWKNGINTNNAGATRGILSPHRFLDTKLTSGVHDASVQKLLANFRAYGGRLETKPREQPTTSPSLALNKSKNSMLLVDCFDVYKHQRLPILCSIHATESSDSVASFCVFPWILVIEFYGKNDLTLGDYLQTFCFRTGAHCPNQQCQKTIKEHIRRFASGDAVISVIIKDLQNVTAPPLPRVVTWTWCKVCREAGPVVPLSSSAWSMSFANYLNLRFHAVAYHRSGMTSCRHSLHRDHYQYFAFGHTVAAFKLSVMQLREIKSPAMVILIDDYKTLPDRHELVEMTKVIAVKGHNVFATINDYLNTCLNLELEKLEEQLHTLLAACRTEKQLFRDRLECIQVKLASPMLKFDSVSYTDADHQKDYVWDIEDSLTNIKRKITEAAVLWSGYLADIEAARKREERKQVSLKTFQSTPEFVREESVAAPIPIVAHETSSDQSSFEMGTPTFSIGTTEFDPDEEELRSADLTVPRSEVAMHHSATTVGLQGPYDVPDALPYRASAKKSVQSHGMNAVPLPYPPNEHHVLPETARIQVVVYDDELSSMIAYALSSNEYQTQLEDQKRVISTKKEPRSSRNVSGESSAYLTCSESPKSFDARSPGMAFLRAAVEGSAPFYHVEHSMFGPATDNETEYSEPASSRAPEPTSKPKPPNKSAANDSKQQQFIEIQFSDQMAKFYCRIYFPEEFRQLRSVLFPYGEDRYIRSLSRSVAWKAAGGKSGSTFSKTSDGRFVLKQMSRLEVQSFVEFAPHYFAYLLQAAKERRPTVITKVVGVYRIGFRNSQTGAGAKQDLLVMENLFYGHKIQQVYDLKGSLRNRLASTDTKADAELVLLDENFLKCICENPLYIRPHAKTFLRKALNTDTQFLANLYVMDYSLLVGIDDDSKEIIVGIIDYIRTFTWDKRLEMVVKSTGLLGGQGKLPTIVSPELYRTRFCEAMERYFLPVPDQWYGLTKQTEST